MKIATRIVLVFVLSLIFTGCVVVVKSYSGHHNTVVKDYDTSKLDVGQTYKH